jgi:hypothetical protein
LVCAAHARGVAAQVAFVKAKFETRISLDDVDRGSDEPEARLTLEPLVISNLVLETLA